MSSLSENHIIFKKKDCCGCTACYAVCPKDAICMCEDEEGFLYPSIDEDKCINCGLCIKTCPIHAGNKNEKTSSFYAVKHSQEEVRASSSSGGVFSAMAQRVIDNNGVVYGAAYDDSFVVQHVRREDQTWIALRTSKYVQSNMGDIFKQVKADLEAGREVLFTGTPCQVDGLKLYLKGIDTTRLITSDLICHGVPSPGIWKEYLTFLSKKTGKSIGKINFRNKKDHGWRNSTMKVESTEETVLIDQAKNQAFFFLLFFNHLILRPCCFSCQYANLHRAGDITIGDYWGVEKYHPELDDDKGISLVMANTSKGKEFLATIFPDCSFVSIAEEECMQPNLEAPAKDYGRRRTFWKAYKKYGLEFAGKRMGCLEKNFLEKIIVLCMKIGDRLEFYVTKK